MCVCVCDVAWRGVAWRGVAWRGVAWLSVSCREKLIVYLVAQFLDVLVENLGDSHRLHRHERDNAAANTLSDLTAFVRVVGVDRALNTPPRPECFLRVAHNLRLRFVYS